VQRGLEPGRTLLLDLPVEVGLARARQRAHGGDRFEDETRRFFERVRAGYLELARRAPARCRVIDARADAPAVVAPRSARCRTSCRPERRRPVERIACNAIVLAGHRLRHAVTRTCGRTLPAALLIHERPAGGEWLARARRRRPCAARPAPCDECQTAGVSPRARIRPAARRSMEIWKQIRVEQVRELCAEWR
jgi:hypothetical protein